MFTLKLKHHFDAAHHLKNPYSKECQGNHGHSFRVKVEIRVPELINNMVVDFKQLKTIINLLDHKDLNKVLDFDPTAENITQYLYSEIDALLRHIGYKHPSTIITLWESDNASIMYSEYE